MGAALWWLRDGPHAGVGCSSSTLSFSWTVTLIILVLRFLRARLLRLCCTATFPALSLHTFYNYTRVHCEVARSFFRASCAYVCVCMCVGIFIRAFFCSECCMHFLGVLGTSAWAGVYVTQVCFYTNVHVCEHTRCRLCTYVYMYIWVCMHAFAYGCVCASMILLDMLKRCCYDFLSVHTCAYVIILRMYMCVHVCVYRCMCICMYMYIYICLCICMHINLYMRARGCKYALV